MGLQERIEAAISDHIGEPARLASTRASSGGCINNSRVVTLDDGSRFFVKTNSQSAALPGLFETEYLALQRLRAPGVIDVPEPVACDADFIIMYAFNPGSKAADWHEQTGCGLARLHRATCQDQFGFDQLNYIGTTAQPNDWHDNWVDFYREQRLGWQLQVFAAKTTADDQLLLLGERLLQQLDNIIGQIQEPAVLLHGDLWSGNAAANASGAPIIFDPASYYGQREAELGMMRLFGGFGPRCEAAYNEVWPLEPEADRRIALYRLYHELNHLNLFGSGYYSSCIDTLRGVL